MRKPLGGGATGLQRLRIAFACILLPFTTAAFCDYIAGISRTARISEMPPATCIESAISSVGGVESVRHEVREGSRPLTLTGIKPPDTVHYFFYTTRQQGGAVLHVLIDYKGETELAQSLFAINQTPSQEDIDAIRPVMLQVEHALEAQCGLASLSTALEELCTGVECPVE
jgi:hypothetical protein